jgi:hypothetical protein
MSDVPQNYKNHTKFVPAFHFVLLPLLMANFIAMSYHAWQAPSWRGGWTALMALALVMIPLLGRVFALGAQDRVIRLEERMRMHDLLPAELQGRIKEFTPSQLIGLRFASDAELPELAAIVLRDRIEKRNAIKKMVKNWRADTLRL